MHTDTTSPPLAPPRRSTSQAGFSMLELLVSMAIMMIVSGTVMEGVFRLTKQGQTISNRSEMHAGVRNATELLQQEVGQAGRVGFPNRLQLASGVTAAALLDSAQVVTVKAVDSAGATISSAVPIKSMFVGEQVVVDAGNKAETVTITSINPTWNTFTAVFTTTHDVNAPVAVYGGIRQGIIPTNVVSGSTGSVLKMVGDINSDGNLEYIEYSCDTTSHNLYRRTMPFDTPGANKPAIGASMSLLTNVIANPDGTPCFTYQEKTASGATYVVDVAITLTVQTQDKDPVTGLYQTETKALLNVSPRNVFNTWQMAAQGITSRIQPLPPTVSTLKSLP